MRVLTIPAFILAALLSACIIVVGDDGGSPGHWDDDGHSTVNRAIRIGEAQTVGDLDSVNGSIELGDRSVAESVETVNGSIRIGDDVVVDSIESVNGNVRAGTNLRVAEDIETVNGSLELAAGTRIGGSIDAVNGNIVMTQTRLEGEISTVGSDALVVRRVLDQVIDFIEELHLAELVAQDVEILRLPLHAEEDGEDGPDADGDGPEEER